MVVATRNRPARLGRLLEALALQSLPRERLEVVVVCDGAGPATHRVIAAADGLPLRTVTLRTPHGPGGARNAGWRAARAPQVAFTDDDCRPERGWLEALLAHAGERRFVQGRTLPDPEDAQAAGLLSRTVRVEQLGPQFETCNILYPREVLERLGGFDEGYGLIPGGEDTDLAWRALASGCRAVLAPEAVVHHAVERLGGRGMLRNAARWSATTRIFRDHPATRAMLHRRVFWNVWHYLMWRSLLALTLPVPLRLLIVGRHLDALRRRAAEQGAGVTAVPFLLVHDAVECWAIARGALRHRTLVL